MPERREYLNYMISQGYRYTSFRRKKESNGKNFDKSTSSINFRPGKLHNKPRSIAREIFYFEHDCCLPSGIASRTIGFDGLTYGTSHLKYPFLSNCNMSPRFIFRMFESPTAMVSFFVHGFNTSRKSSPSSSCNSNLKDG